jgi:predicted metalloprotease with PDZ domain
MRTGLLLSAMIVAAPMGLSAQVRIQTAPGAFAYVMGDPDRPMIGISTRNSGKRDTLGLLVESVTSGGPAEKAGIEEGDRLVSVNSVNLRLSVADAGEPDMEGVPNRRLIRELEKHKAGDEVELRVWRDGNTRSVRVKTVAADELNKSFFASTNEASSFSQFRGDRAALGLSLGGNGSRRDTLGILVVGVADDGPAAKAGIDEGDRVSAINGVDLRVAAEDAGDSQASRARANRLNRELGKLEAGDTVQLRVYSSGQMRTVRVTAVKASEIEGEGFLSGTYQWTYPSTIRSMTMPRAGAVRVRPPAEFEEFFNDARTKAEFEKSLKAAQEAFKSSAKAMAPLKEQLKLKNDAFKKTIVRSSAII